MRKLILVVLLLTPLAANAQQPPPTIPVPVELGQRINSYLTIGGTHSEGIGLAGELRQAYMASQQQPVTRPGPPASITPDASK